MALFLCTAFALGSLGAFAMAPRNLFFVLFVSLSGLYVLLARTNRVRDAFFVGWFFSFGYFLFSLSWVGNALLVEDNPYRWAWPLAICGLPFILAPFTATACGVIKKFINLQTLSGFCGAVLIFSTAEWLRGHLFTGFPWNLYGYAWADVGQVVQSTYLFSVYGLTALTILWAMMPGFIWVSCACKRTCALALGVAVISFFGVFMYGQMRIGTYTPVYQDNIRVRIVSPYIPQHEKWQSSKTMENFFAYIQKSYPPMDSAYTGETYIVWPETAVTSWLLDDEGAMEIVTQMLSAYPGKAYLFTGMLRYDQAADIHYNSLVMIDAQGRVQNIYDKHHLVPFGEYIPFGKFIPIPAINRFSAFGAGSALKTMSVPEGLVYSPLVCYEAIFAKDVVKRQDRRDIDFLINVTNDAWYYNTAGPAQHFTHARFRAVEEGIPMIRSANGGVSAIIDPIGNAVSGVEILQKLPKSLQK